VSRDDRSWNDGDKLSFSERDRLRREGGHSEDHRPKGVSKAKAESASKQYLKRLDGLFSEKQGGGEAEALEAAVRATHGTPKLAVACREYVDAVGLPAEAGLIGMFLDCGDAELVIGGLRALKEGSQAGAIQVSGGLRSQVRMLAEDPNDEIAELAEEIVEGA
jgi:hypothetical protein